MNKNNQAGVFAGWISERHRIAWVVNPMRRDKRTGVIRDGG